MPRPRLTLSDYLAGIRAGDRGVLSRAITLVESRLASDRALAANLLDELLSEASPAFRIGITGSPGVGKSTFLEAFGLARVAAGHRVAVLTIDPTSQRSGGSILGDKTRMQALSAHPDAYVRPSPSGRTIGGVSWRTREAAVLCAAAGFDPIFIETVGVGQSETAVHDMVDAFVLLQLAGAGDHLQGIKRGIMELADLLFITKADGPNVANARQAASEFRHALHLLPPGYEGWRPRVLTTSALDKTGLADAWNALETFQATMQGNGGWQARRQHQRHSWFLAEVNQALHERFFQQEAVKAVLPQLEQDVLSGTLAPTKAAFDLLELALKAD